MKPMLLVLVPFLCMSLSVHASGSPGGRTGEPGSDRPATRVPAESGPGEARPTSPLPDDRKAGGSPGAGDSRSVGESAPSAADPAADGAGEGRASARPDPAYPARPESPTPPPRGPSIEWSGGPWSVRESYEPANPLNNYFSPSPLTVAVDDAGKLHLWITFWDDTWWASEIFQTGTFGYGTYLWRVDSPLDRLDEMAVFGLFTFSPDADYHHREIDIEFAAWGVPESVGRMQYVVQPYAEPGNLESILLRGLPGPTSHAFTWRQDRIDFVSWAGHGPEPREGDPGLIHRWSMTDASKIPPPGNEQVHISFYLTKGGKYPPAIGHAIEIILSSFVFIPLEEVPSSGTGNGDT